MSQKRKCGPRSCRSSSSINSSPVATTAAVMVDVAAAVGMAAKTIKELAAGMAAAALAAVAGVVAAEVAVAGAAGVVAGAGVAVDNIGL